MDPSFRRWWRHLDDLPHNLTQVTSWTYGPPPPLPGDGHLHVAPTAVACLDGVVRVVSPNRSIDLVAGQALIIGAGVWHRHEPVRRGSVWFSQGFLPAFSEVMLADHEREWNGRLPSHPCRRLMDTVVAATNGEARLQAFRSLMNQVLVESVEDLHVTNPALQRMIARFSANLHRGVGVKDLVRASGLSRAQAYRVFSDGYGVPLKDAIETSRLWLSEALLSQGLSIAAVAERSGWPSPDTFARAWKRHHGTPPSRLMRQAKRMEESPVHVAERQAEHHAEEPAGRLAGQSAQVVAAANAFMPRQLAFAGVR
jgi:AraC-like DNA-binding protein